MIYSYLGQTGMKVSRICLGTMQFGWSANEQTSKTIMNKAYDLGINFFDTANVYSRWNDKSYPGKSEEIIGQWLKESGNRDEIILATKVKGKMWDPKYDSRPEVKNLQLEGLSRRHILHQIEASLKRLQTKWIDLYQAHSMDPEVPIQETLNVFTDLIRQGKVNHIGASNYAPWALIESLWVAEKYGLRSFQTLQPYYNLVDREPFEKAKQLICQRYNIAVIPYSPLAAGFLTGKYRKDMPMPESERASRIKENFMNDKGFASLDVLDQITKSKEATLTQISLAWLLKQPTVVSPIIGANSIAQLEDIVQAVDIKLSTDDLKLIEAN